MIIVFTNLKNWVFFAEVVIIYHGHRAVYILHRFDKILVN